MPDQPRPEDARDLHRSRGTHEETPDGWFEACPLPFYGIRKRCECGRKFWREDAYRHHWREENRRAIDADSKRETPDA